METWKTFDSRSFGRIGEWLKHPQDLGSSRRHHMPANSRYCRSETPARTRRGKHPRRRRNGRIERTGGAPAAPALTSIGRNDTPKLNWCNQQLPSCLATSLMGRRPTNANHVPSSPIDSVTDRRLCASLAPASRTTGSVQTPPLAALRLLFDCSLSFEKLDRGQFTPTSPLLGPGCIQRYMA